MPKRKPDKIFNPFDENPWDTEIDLLVKRDGCDLEAARYFTIMKYMSDGDLRPLADAILRGLSVDLNLFH